MPDELSVPDLDGQGFCCPASAAAVRTQSAGHPIRTVAPRRQQSRKCQVRDLQQGSQQVTDLADYLETKKA
ncbi:hypothetical protein GCM10010211_02930 [Streptomyces albospinus]|uniref:Uncharacterized protein n=1 Tax=Streptomyces albospinus TaxID=285515 RepID=A0ABQ2UL26_9ACTN|nr:hypothetical protein GCM10010211_02930 [Streptomyces albospinus]